MDDQTGATTGDTRLMYAYVRAPLGKSGEAFRRTIRRLNSCERDFGVLELGESFFFETRGKAVGLVAR